ncbi:hypothetical protein BLOT_007734 [Blomia tropicalis]|nr:hypothetical protein BLOT_007734 [Blomia tropicalis]
MLNSRHSTILCCSYIIVRGPGPMVNSNGSGRDFYLVNVLNDKSPKTDNRFAFLNESFKCRCPINTV